MLNISSEKKTKCVSSCCWFTASSCQDLQGVSWHPCELGSCGSRLSLWGSLEWAAALRCCVHSPLTCGHSYFTCSTWEMGLITMVGNPHWPSAENGLPVKKDIQSRRKVPLHTVMNDSKDFIDHPPSWEIMGKSDIKQTMMVTMKLEDDDWMSNFLIIMKAWRKLIAVKF